MGSVPVACSVAVPPADAAMADEATGTVMKVSGPLVVAEKMSGTKVYEVVRVGRDGLVGEIIRLEGDTASMQVYEVTSGLTVGDPLVRTGLPLSMELDPGILDGIYEGIQRPLERIQQLSKRVFVPRGVDVPNADRARLWDFTQRHVKGGDLVTGGDLVGVVRKNGLFREHCVMVHPGVAGWVKKVLQAGRYTLGRASSRWRAGKTACEQLFQRWPVRQVRPVVEQLQGNTALLTCERVIVTLFPVTQGGTAAVPGAFGCGKMMISQALSKHSNYDVVVYSNVVVRCALGLAGADDAYRRQGGADHAAGDAHGQHLEHARGRAGGLHLHRRDDGGVLPRHGLYRGDDGGQHLPLGGGPPRDLRPTRREARGRWLPDVPRRPAGVLRRVRELRGRCT